MTLLLVKILGPIVLLAGLWFWHTSAVESADKTGYDRGIAQWRESDKIAKAVGDETTALLKRGAAANEGKLNAKLADLEKRGALAVADARSVRNDLAAIASAAPASAPAGPTCRNYEAQYRSCAGLLGEGFELAGEGAILAKDIAARLEALQDDARAVRAAH